MYIVLIALVYIWMLMIITAPSVLAALGVILFGGMALWVVYYILNTPARRRRREQEDEF